MVLWTDRSNTQGVRLYKRAGFEARWDDVAFIGSSAGMNTVIAKVPEGVTAKDMAQSHGQPMHPGAEKYYREAGLLK